MIKQKDSIAGMFLAIESHITLKKFSKPGYYPVDDFESRKNRPLLPLYVYIYNLVIILTWVKINFNFHEIHSIYSHITISSQFP
jgi:hypothetical protein